MTDQLNPNNPYLDALLTRRLQTMGGSGLSAGMSFDLASGLDWHEAHSLDQLGVPTYAKTNAASSILNSVVSQHAPLLPVGDIMSYQNKLKGLGYLPQDYTPTGQWDTQSESAAYELNQHASDAFAQGHSNPLAITASKGFDLLNATMPSKIFQGLVGAVEGIGKSFGGTFSRIGRATALAFTGHEGEAWKVIKSHALEDVMNALTVASMFVGVGDIVEAGRSLFGAFDAGEGLAKLVAKPVADELAANAAKEGTSLSSRLVGNVIGRFSSGAQDNFLNWVAQNGFNAQAQRPLLKIASNVYGGLSKAAFFPQAESILIPHSAMGQKVSKAPTLPGVVDWSTLFLHPDVGLTPFKTFAHAFSPLSAGIMDFTRLAGIKEPVDAVSRVSMATQAFAHNEAAQKIAGETGTGAYRLRAFERAISAEKANAIVDAADGTRHIDPEYAQKAIDWSNKHPYAAAAFVKSLQTSAQAREGLGLTGFNPEPAYRNAENLANELTQHLGSKKPALVELSNKLSEADAKVEALSKAAQNGDQEAFVQLQQARKVQSDIHAEADATEFGGFVKDPDLAKKLDGGELRVLPQRWDNPRTKQEVSKLIDSWNGAKSDAEREGIRKTMRIMGLGDVSDAETPEHLKVLLDMSPTDISEHLPEGFAAELQSHGYKAVAGGNDVFLRSDVNPLSVQLPKYSNLAYLTANLGLSTHKIDPQAVGRMVNATTAQSWDEVLRSFDAERFPAGSGQNILDDWHSVQNEREKALATTGMTESKVQRMLTRAKLNIQNTSISGLSNFLHERWIPDAGEAKSLAKQLQKAALQSNFHPGLVNSPSHALGILDEVGAALRVHGLPGLLEGLRSMTVSDLGRLNLGSLAGGVAGYEGSKQAGATDKEALVSGVVSAILGQKAGKVLPVAKFRPLGKFADSAFGFLPDHLMRAALAARFTFSPMFEARLLTKGQVIRGTKYNLPMSFQPLKTMTRDGTLQDYSRIWQAATGSNKELDEASRLMTNAGIFGYDVRNHSILDYGRMYDRLTASDKIRGVADEVAHTNAIDWLREHGPSINTFGPRSAAEKSINAIFFPFSFEKKFVGAMHDYFTAAPVRTLLVHHALKFADHLDQAEPGQQSKWQQLIERHAPILKEINKLNALAYGVSAGDLGGVFKPLGETLGVAGEALAGAILPHVVTEDTSKKFAQLAPRLVPAWRDIANAKDDLLQTVRGLEGETTRGQISDYYALKHAKETEFADLGMPYGTDGTIASFEASKRVPAFLKQQWLEEKTKLDLRFPEAAKYNATIANKSALRQADLLQLLGRTHMSPVQEGIGRVVEAEALYDTMPKAASRNVQMKLMQEQMKTQGIRRAALAELQRFGLPFNDLWVRYGFEREFGPIVAPPEELQAA